MTRNSASSAILMALCIAGCAVAQGGDSERYLLKDEEINQWCVYSNKAEWEADVNRTNASEVGALFYTQGNLTRIDVTETDETGDWAIYDSYFLTSRGNLEKLLRVTNVLPGNLSVSEEFMLGDDGLEKISAVKRSLDTKEVIKPSDDGWIPETRLFTKIDEFPFGRLIARDKLDKTRVCAGP